MASRQPGVGARRRLGGFRCGCPRYKITITLLGNHLCGQRWFDSMGADAHARLLASEPAAAPAVTSQLLSAPPGQRHVADTVVAASSALQSALAAGQPRLRPAGPTDTLSSPKGSAPVCTICRASPSQDCPQPATNPRQRRTTAAAGHRTSHVACLYARTNYGPDTHAPSNRARSPREMRARTAPSRWPSRP